MSSSEEDETEDTKKLAPGDLLSFGSVNLLFTLNLEKHDIKKYKIKWDKLESLENLKFIRKHKSLWKKVEISSENDKMNILLHINKSSQKLIKIGFIAFKKIKYEDNQTEFKKFIEAVTTQNGLFLTSCDVCSSSVCIQLLLKYEDKEKKFVILGQPESDKKEDVKGEDDNKIQEEHVNENNEEKKNNNEEEKEEKKEEPDNPFIKITEDIVVPGEYNYIYFNYNDYINGELCGKIKIEHLLEYSFVLYKSTRKSKIIRIFSKFKIINKNQNYIKFRRRKN